MLAEWNKIGRDLAAIWLPQLPGKNDLDAAITALHGVTEQFEHGTRTWYTVQLADGNIVGKWGRSMCAAVIELAFWWGHDVVWIADDSGCDIYARYYDTVPVAKKDSARWVVTDGPAEHPLVQGETMPASMPVTLFELEAL